jgi:hypothetical protein
MLKKTMVLNRYYSPYHPQSRRTTTKAAYGNLSTFAGHFHRDPGIVFFLIQLAKAKHLEESTARYNVEEKEINNTIIDRGKKGGDWSF